MSMLGDESAGKREAFMSQNRMYYLSGGEDQLGLLHPYFHDLRSRGTGIAEYEPTDGSPKAGVGNDYSGWEWYRDTSVAVGTIMDQGTALTTKWVAPNPTRMWWRPDKVISEYELESPYLAGGLYKGFCSTGSQTQPGVDWWGWYNFDDPSQCWQKCEESLTCQAAVYENDIDDNTQCWIGPNLLSPDSPPDGSQRGNNPDYNATCFVKGIHVEPLVVREEKFIALNEVVAAKITASRPVKLRIEGGSFTAKAVNKPHSGTVGGLTTLNGTCEYDPVSDTIKIVEDGRAEASVLPDVKREGPFVLNGLSAVLAASRPLENLILTTSQGHFGMKCDYSFEFTLGPNEDEVVVLTYAMDEEEKYPATLQRVRDVANNIAGAMSAKTDEMNRLLNEVVPYFRCSDSDIVKIYYFLWSVYLMLVIDVKVGLTSYPHTQSAANNFLGLHRFDATFQIRAGAWTNPSEHNSYAHGNVLVWENVFRRGLNSSNMLPDNFGQDWGSAIFGNEVCIHIIGAVEIYEHSGDLQFLEKAYGFYKDLYWNNCFFAGNVANLAIDGVHALVKMATILGTPQDAQHWLDCTQANWWMGEYHRNQQAAFWEDPQIWNITNPDSGFGWLEIARLGTTSLIKREWVERMGKTWLVDANRGHFDAVPLSSVPMKNYRKDDDEDGNPLCPLGHGDTPGKCTGGVDKDFTIVPDANFFMIRTLYLHRISDIGNKALLAHLKRYNMEHGLPVAPEARKLDLTEFGNQFNNFNAGKIILFLKGFGGLEVSNTEDKLVFSESLPTNWTFMEFRVPVSRGNTETTWIKTRVERERVEGDIAVKKKITVDNNPFKKLIVRPWKEGAQQVLSATPEGSTEGETTGSLDGHLIWFFNNESSAEIEVVLNYENREEWDGGVNWDGSLEAEGILNKYRDYACWPDCET